MSSVVQRQGVTIVERSDENGILVLHPDGMISTASSRDDAEAKAKRWYARHVDSKSIGVGEIEYRGFDAEA